MNNQEIFEKIKEIFRDVFDNPKLEIDRSTNSSNIEDWDSLNHINLIVAMEKEFKTRFNLEDIQGLKNVGEMADLIERKLQK